MNGKRARLLRGLMGVECNQDTTKYSAVPHTVRSRPVKIPSTNADGTMTEKIVAYVNTATLKGDYRPRALYQMMKKAAVIKGAKH